MDKKDTITFTGTTKEELEDFLGGLSESQLSMLKMHGEGVVRKPDGTVRSHFKIKPDEPLEDSDDGGRTDA